MIDDYMVNKLGAKVKFESDKDIWELVVHGKA
jgi:hypothetical protein